MTAEPIRMRADPLLLPVEPVRVDLTPARPRAPAAMPGAVHERPIGIAEVSSFLRASWKPAAVLAALFGALGVAYCVTTTPAYTASAQILIEADRAQNYFGDAQRAESPNETGRVESQIEIIKSDRTAQAVIRKLNLPNDPEFMPGPPPRFTLAGLLPFLRAEAPPSSAEETQLARLNIAAAAFGSRLGVRRIGQSFVAEVQFKSSDPAKAATIVDGVLAAFIEGDVQAKAENARRANQWLSERLTEVRGQVSASRRAVEHFKTGSEVGNLGERYVKLAELESVAQSQSKLYDTFLQRYIETAQRITFPVPDARVIANATRPLARSHPKTVLIVAFASLFGAATGIGAAALRRSADRSIRSADAATAAAGVAVLCQLPKVRRPRRDRENPIPAADLLGNAGFELRTLKAALTTELLGQRSRIVGVTSCEAGAGKSTVAAALATAFARAGVRTLLVDGCADRPSLSRTLAPEARFGLAQLVEHVDMASRLVVPQPGLDNLFVMPVGEVTAGTSPAEAVASTQPRAVVSGITSAFDMVVVDLPALDAAADARALAPFLSGLVLVVEGGRTTADALVDAAETLNDGYTTILGLVLNKTKTRQRAGA